jgi:hypothetical protein
MQRPDLDTLAGVNPACQCLRRPGEGPLTVRKISGHDRLRLLRCRPCGEECSARRGRALFTPTLPDARAAAVIHHRDEGCSVRATARLVHVAQATVARLLRVAGRQAPRCHEPPVPGLTPNALECDAPGRVVKKSRRGARRPRGRRRVPGGTIRRWLRTGSGSALWWGVHARTSPPRPWCTTPKVVSVRDLGPRSSRRRMRATSRPSSQPLVAVPPPLATAPQGVRLVPSAGGRTGWPLAQ